MNKSLEKGDFYYEHKLYKKAASLGYALKENNLALCYLNGYRVRQDYCKTFYWLEKAVKRENNDVKKVLLIVI